MYNSPTFPMFHMLMKKKRQIALDSDVVKLLLSKASKRFGDLLKG